MRPVYETVIFDKDGTLLDSAPGIIHSMEYALGKMGRSMPPGLDARSLIGAPLQWIYNVPFGFAGDELGRAVDLHREYYGEHGLFEAEPYPGIPGLLRDLHASGVKVCVATSKFHTLARRMLDHFGLSPWLHYAVMSDGSELTSTKKDMIARVLEFCGTPEDRALMVGDSAYDAQGARDAGVAFAGVLFGYGTRAQMEESGAEHFAADTVELRNMLFKRAGVAV